MRMRRKPRIGKVVVAKLADIYLPGTAVCNVHSGCEHIRGNALAGGKIIRAAGGNISERGVTSAKDHAGNGLVERAVAADGDDDVKLSRVQPCKLGRIAALAGRENAHDIVVCGENSDNIGQKSQRDAPAGNGVYDEHHAL